MRSVVVVLPASMCAMMPMLRQRSRGKVRATAIAPTECGALRRQGLDEELPEKDRLPQRKSERAFTQQDAPRQDRVNRAGSKRLSSRRSPTIVGPMTSMRFGLATIPTLLLATSAIELGLAETWLTRSSIRSLPGRAGSRVPES